TVDLVFDARLEFDVEAETCNAAFCIPLTDGQASADAQVTSHLALGDLDIGMGADIDKTYQQPMHLAITRLDTNIGNFDLEPIQDVTLTLSITGISGLINTQYQFRLSDFIDLGALFGQILNPVANQLGQLLPQLLNPVIQQVMGPVLSGLFDLFVVDT